MPGLAVVPASLAGLVVAFYPGVSPAAESFEGWEFFFGELHAHTGYSGDAGSNDLGNCPGDACGDAADFFDIARHEAGLDFCAITDHTNSERTMDAESWPLVVQLVNEHHDPGGGFVTLLGAEVRLKAEDGTRIGHRNLYFFGDEPILSGIAFDDLKGPGRAAPCDEIWLAVADLDAASGPLLFLPHHPATVNPTPTDWSCQDARYAPVVEIYSAHGNSRDDPGLDPYDPPFNGSTPGSAVNDALAPDGHGYVLGIVGGTDFHDTRPGMVCHLDCHADSISYGGSLTGIFLEAGSPLDRAAIHDALTARHSYATSGPKVPVLLTLRGRDGEELAVTGEVVPSLASLPVVARVSLPATFSPYVISVELYDGARTTTPLEETAAGTFERELADLSFPWFGYAVVTVDGAAWWADQGIECTDHKPAAPGQDTLEKIWTSPIWVDDLAAAEDGAGETCRCVLGGRRSAAGSTVVAALLVLVGARRARASSLRNSGRGSGAPRRSAPAGEA